VRGFEDNTLGPTDSKGNPIGGSVKLVGGTEVLFPLWFMEDTKSFRIGTFLDIGNVYSDIASFDAKELRYSVGVSSLWISPLGPLAISLGFPLNEKSGDNVQNFQFTIGF
jgi:outer membrane protein insertion porin family